MKKVVVLTILSGLLISMFVFASLHRPMSLDNGKYSVNTTSLGDQITFSEAEWNDIAVGTDYTTDKRPPGISITICITIAKETRNCKGGVGFKCGITSCSKQIDPNSNGQNADRIYSAEHIVNSNGSVTITFNEAVDWNWLDL